MRCVLDIGPSERCHRKPANIDRVSADPSDEALLVSVGQGDVGAFNRLLDRHLDAIFRYLARLSQSTAHAEDLSQDTWLRVWQKAHTYRAARGGASSWLYRIAHNAFVDSHRQRRARREQPIAEHDGDDSVDLEVNDQTDRFEQLHSELHRLPTNQRSALALFHWQGFSVSQVADILGVSTRAAESLLTRARRKLRERLTQPQASHD